MSTEGHESTGTVVEQETDRALLVRFNDDVARWVPKSVILDDSEVYEMGTNGTLLTKRWFAEKEELP